MVSPIVFVFADRRTVDFGQEGLEEGTGQGGRHISVWAETHHGCLVHVICLLRFFVKRQALFEQTVCVVCVGCGTSVNLLHTFLYYLYVSHHPFPTRLPFLSSLPSLLRPTPFAGCLLHMDSDKH